MNQSSFANAVHRQLHSFALAHNLVPVRETKGFDPSVLYKNSTTGVRFTFEWRDGIVLVRLYRLQSGEIPSTDVDPANGFSLG